LSSARDKWFCLLSLLVIIHTYIIIYIIRLEFLVFFSLLPVFVTNRNIPSAPHAHHIIHNIYKQYKNHDQYTCPLINLFFLCVSADSKRSLQRGLPKRFNTGYRYFQTVFPGSFTSVNEVRD